jgi:hypothetical protein
LGSGFGGCRYANSRRGTLDAHAPPTIGREMFANWKTPSSARPRPILPVGDLPSSPQYPTTERVPEKDEILPLEELERRAILHTLPETGGDKLSAARMMASARPLSTASSSSTTWSPPRTRASDRSPILSSKPMEFINSPKIETARNQILFVTQRNQRIYFRGSPRRNKTSH